MNKELKFKYKKKNLIVNLILGIVWAVFGTVVIISSGDDQKASDFGYLAFGIVYFGLYFFNYTQHYIVVKNGIIKEPGYFGSKLEIEAITSIRKFAGDYILTDGNKKLHVNTELIDPDSLQDLLEFVDSLELKKGK